MATGVGGSRRADWPFLSGGGRPWGAPQTGPVKMEWLSWSIVRFTSPDGKLVVTNPYVANPDSPVKLADFPKVDVIVVADWHGDEVGSTDEIAIKTGAKVGAPSRWGTSSSSRGRVPLGAGSPERAR